MSRIDEIRASCNHIYSEYQELVELLDLVIKYPRAAKFMSDAADALNAYADEISRVTTQVEQLEAELAGYREAERGQWIETASDNTNYVLAYANGIYCVTDAFGNVVCEFIREDALQRDNPEKEE